ncbi:hypothetical protein CHLRE_03g183050v5 [Chlamydomonas reinhardtii]|uniref:Uncharacterized protein n=1 Tax=Chlamydomonas reinhardtii TaxID=3055 RepID=A8JH76_CHLRE|nr:uncharacterized protein CHLRE_03g183050v5 [Chlamydomonas reinhardtii]PNW85366.1 hypothetical protein CHLRE_03g183050v5 [Chlamydomonas reinhardtii]|eukprot:XP_001702923.1 predicted protein [Chlamydomonas reinhardtii]
MRISTGGALTLLGLLGLAHTTLAVIQYRQVLKLSQEEFEALPASILLELVLSAAVAVLGGYLLTGSVKVAIMPAKGRSMDISSLRTDFISFNTRSRAMPLDIPPLTS